MGTTVGIQGAMSWDIIGLWPPWLWLSSYSWNCTSKYSHEVTGLDPPMVHSTAFLEGLIKLDDKGTHMSTWFDDQNVFYTDNSWHHHPFLLNMYSMCSSVYIHCIHIQRHSQNFHRFAQTGADYRNQLKSFQVVSSARTIRKKQANTKISESQ